MLNLPAGDIEPDEAPREVIVRECKEVIGIEINPDDLEFVHIQFNRNLGEKGDRTHYYFRFVSADVVPINTEPEKCSEVLWIEKGALLDEFIPFMKGALEEIFTQELYSEFYDAIEDNDIMIQ